MKTYKEQSNHWKTGKALGFFANFIHHHTGMVEDNDIFELIAKQAAPDAWEKLIRETFPAATITRLQKLERRSDRLDFDDAPKEILREIWSAPFARVHLLKMLDGIVERYFAEHPVARSANEPFAKRCAELKSTLRLSDFEMELLLVFDLSEEGLLPRVDGHRRSSSECDKAVFAAKCLDCDVSEVLSTLDAKRKLRRYGCVDSDFDFNGALRGFLNGTNSEPLTSSFFRQSREEPLPWDFFGSVAETHGTLLKRIIDGADGKTPVNILLYGAPGTGKTSFARTLAAELKRDCFIVAQHRPSRRPFDSEPGSPEFRFSALQICNDQVDPAHSLIIVDEADEMLRGHGGGLFALFGLGGGTVGDKGLLNSVLDTLTVPTIWLANTAAEELDESSRRRFDYSIRFEALNHEQRRAIWRNNVEKMDLGTLIPEAMIDRFAVRYPVSAGGISLVLRNLVKLAPAPGEVEKLVDSLMKPHCELLEVTAAHEDRMRPAQDYSLSGLNIRGSLPPERIVEAVRRFRQDPPAGIDRPRMNILLSGAPGTGKTEFVKYLGSALNAKVLVKMGSDLLSMYVGGTEKLIRQAFAQAEAEHAILFLDEIDGLVQSRARAERSWEVTQVNELLYQMENFPGVMIGATNFVANLDAAILRRFTFKLEFDYLDEAGKKLFFERMFQTELSASEAARLAAIPHLAPGDFRTVRQSFFYLGGEVSNDDRIAALRQESDNKRKLRYAEDGKHIGF